MKPRICLIVLFFTFFCSSSFVFGQVWTGTEVLFNHSTFGGNYDYTSIYRADSESDRTRLRIQMGDEVTSDFEIGYMNWETSQWVSTFTLDGYGNTFIRGIVGIGTTLANNPNNYTFAVKGKIGAHEIQVENTSATWADYVFEKGYDLKTLKEIEEFIQENNHLPEVPSKKEIETNGHKLGEMDVILLKKVEELTLYMIEANKQIEKLNREIQELKSKQEPKNK